MAAGKACSDEDGQDADKKKSDKVFGDLAKWLVPSATAVFVAVGYIVETAQEGLLGLSAPSTDTARYVGNAAEFLIRIITMAAGLDAKAPYAKMPYLTMEFVSLAVATLGVVLLLVLPLFSTRDLRRWSLVSCTVLLAILAICKFTAFDAPLSKVHDVVRGIHLETGGSHGELISDSLGPVPTQETINAGLAVADSSITRRARVLFDKIVCAHVADQILVNCTRSKAATTPPYEFMALLWTTILMIVLAVAILHAPAAGVRVKAFAVFGLLSCLTLPYGFGKLLKATEYDFGQVRLAKPLQGDFPASAADQPLGSLYALILSRGGTSIDILEQETLVCSLDKNKTYQTIRLASLSPSQVYSVERIYPQDVIGWSALQQTSCPKLCMGPACHPKA